MPPTRNATVFHQVENQRAKRTGPERTGVRPKLLHACPRYSSGIVSRGSEQRQPAGRQQTDEHHPPPLPPSPPHGPPLPTILSPQPMTNVTMKFARSPLAPSMNPSLLFFLLSFFFLGGGCFFIGPGLCFLFLLLQLQIVSAIIKI